MAYGNSAIKDVAFSVMTESRELSKLLPRISATNPQPSLRRSTADPERSDGSPGERRGR